MQDTDKEKISPFKKLYRLFDRSDKLKVFGLFILMVIGSLLEVLGIGMIPAFIMAIAQPEKFLEYPYIGDFLINLNIVTSEDLLKWGAISLIAVFIIKNAYLTLFYYWKSTFIRNRQIKIGRDLFAAYMTAPYTFHLGRNSAELLRNATFEVKQLIQQVLIMFLKLGMDLMLIVFIFIMLIIIEPWITLITICIFGLSSGIFLKIIRSRIKKFGKQEQKSRKEMNKAVNQGLGGIKDTRVLGKENYFINVYSKSNVRGAEAAKFKEVMNQATKPVIETFAVTSLLIIALILLFQGKGIGEIIPILVLFGVASTRLMPAFKELTTSWTNLRYAIYSVNPIYDDLKELNDSIKNVSRQKGKAPSRMKFQNSISVCNVSYKYPAQQEYALKNISFDIPRGMAIAFVGATGAGKTTIADLLLGLLEPESGKILVDGIDISTNFPGWQHDIGYIPQVIYLLDDTIKKNIAWGLKDEEIDNDKLENAVRAAQMDEFLEHLPQKLDTVIGERGVRLSGGQRQRIGIARALYHNPEVLIMDEATSSLDNMTEKYVIDSVERLKGDRTIIMIAHRLTTVQNCDMIYFLRKGKLEDQGNYLNLISNNKEFQEMAVVSGTGTE